jgi:retron-type reverse transcriptase
MLFDKNRDKLLLDLQRKLINGEYETSEYYVFKIYEPEEREIFKLPYYPDRIVHHAIMNIMEPIWVSAFIKGTYSCIRKRGIHKALRDVKFALKDEINTQYCLKLDIRKFYPSIDHDILKTIIRKKIKDKRLLSLLDEIIESA